MSAQSWLEVIIAVGTVVAIFGVNVGWRWAPAVGLATSPAWIAATALSGNWGMLIASIACTVSWAIGTWRAFGYIVIRRWNRWRAKTTGPKGGPPPSHFNCKCIQRDKWEF